MKRFKVSRSLFIVVSSLCLTLSLSLAQLSELRREQGHLQEVVSELAGVHEENRDLAERLKQFDSKIIRLQRQKEALEDLLSARAHTYLVVTEGRSFHVSAAMPSRSGYSVEREPLSAVNMPVQSRSGFTGGDFEKAWQAYEAENLKGTGDAFIQAERKYGVNALILAAIVVHESAWGRSAIARHKNNLAGLGAFDGSPYRSAMSFAAKEDSIYFLAKLLSRQYLHPGGAHYGGAHLTGIGRRYASDPRWAVKVAAMMRQIVTAAVENPLEIAASARFAESRESRD